MNIFDIEIVALVIAIAARLLIAYRSRHTRTAAAAATSIMTTLPSRYSGERVRT